MGVDPDPVQVAVGTFSALLAVQVVVVKLLPLPALAAAQVSVPAGPVATVPQFVAV